MADDIIKRRFNAKSYIRVCRSIAFRLQYSTTLLLSGFIKHDLYIFQDFLSPYIFMWKMIHVDPDKMIGMLFFLGVAYV